MTNLREISLHGSLPCLKNSAVFSFPVHVQFISSASCCISWVKATTTHVLLSSFLAERKRAYNTIRTSFLPTGSDALYMCVPYPISASHPASLTDFDLLRRIRLCQEGQRGTYCECHKIYNINDFSSLLQIKPVTSFLPPWAAVMRCERLVITEFKHLRKCAWSPLQGKKLLSPSTGDKSETTFVRLWCIPESSTCNVLLSRWIIGIRLWSQLRKADFFQVE